MGHNYARIGGKITPNFLQCSHHTCSHHVINNLHKLLGLDTIAFDDITQEVIAGSNFRPLNLGKQLIFFRNTQDMPITQAELCMWPIKITCQNDTSVAL